MKKKVLLAAVLASTMGYQAQATSPHTGFSVGANLGIASLDGKLNRDLTPAGGTTDSSNFGARSPVVGIFFGYGWAPNPTGLYLGGEVFGQYEKIKANRGENSNIAVLFSTRLQTNNAFGAAAKIGYLCKDALLFLKAGVASTKFKFNFTNNTLAPVESVSTSPRKTGFLVGLGMDYAIAKNWAVGGEFLYEVYGSLKLSQPGDGTFTYKPKKATANLRLKYTF